MADGVSYESACRSAGIAPRTIYNWKTRATQGDERAIAFVQALEKVEADVERRAVRNTLKAGELPQFWAANMTYLERRYPDRWGRRADDGNVPKVVVQIGVKDSDVQVSISETKLSPPTFAPDEERNPTANSLTGQAYASSSRLIIGDYVNQSASVPGLDGQTDQASAAPDPAGDPTRQGMAPVGVRRAESGKGARRGGRKKKA